MCLASWQRLVFIKVMQSSLKSVKYDLVVMLFHFHTFQFKVDHHKSFLMLNIVICCVFGIKIGRDHYEVPVRLQVQEVHCSYLPQCLHLFW